MRATRVTRGVGLLVCAAGVVLGCSGRIETTAPNGVGRGGGVGSVGLLLQPVAGITVTSVHYAVTHGDPSAPLPPPLVSEGNLPAPGTGSTVSFGVPLPVGTGYYLSLSGVSAELNDDVTCSGVVGPFAVAPNLSTALSLQLTCVDNTKGTAIVGVDVSTIACPRLIVDYAVAEPAVAAIFQTIKVFASAHDLDNPAEPIEYTWSIVDPATGAVGSFTPANARDTSFLCTSPHYSVRILVTAKNHECSKSLETAVSCLADFPSCGDGVVDLLGGETCDWGSRPGHPADPTCPADCTQVCGDGVVEGDENCDPLPLNPAVCFLPGDPSACKTRDSQF